MRILVAALTLAAAGCSDAYWIKRASAAYVYAETRYKQECVEVKGPPSCAQEQKRLKSEYDRISAALDAKIKSRNGKLPKAARADLKAVTKELE